MGSTTSSDMMVLTTLAVISCLMAAETYLTMKLAQSILCALWPSVGESSKANINMLVCLWQLVSYLVSPFVCYQKGLATRNGQSSAENLWKKAEPVKRVGEGFYAAGQVIWWGLPGIFVFAPAVWKWAWAGKTVLGSNQVESIKNMHGPANSNDHANEKSNGKVYHKTDMTEIAKVYYSQKSIRL